MSSIPYTAGSVNFLCLFQKPSLWSQVFTSIFIYLYIHYLTYAIIIIVPAIKSTDNINLTQIVIS